jgi:hypothetical protein
MRASALDEELTQNRLIATAAGLEAFIPRMMQHPAEQNQEWVAVPECRKSPCSVKSPFR